ncbi:MAG: hypothetical protein ACI4OT_02575, partial [Bacilli bacterium]
DIIKNQEEYYDKSLINTGDWLYQNEKNFNEDQKSRLKEVGYYDGPFETHFYYLTKLKEQGESTNLAPSDKIRVKEDGTVEVVKKLTKIENGKKIIKNKEEYDDKSLINTGKWLYTNQEKFSEEQKSRLQEVGYYDTEDLFETHFYYLTKLKEQGESTNLTSSDKIRVKEDGTVEVVKKLTKKENGKDIIKNQEEYYDKSLINTGHWLYKNQEKFSEEQKSRLREVGYYDGSFETHFYYLTKLKEQGESTNLTSSDKIRVKEDGTVEVVKKLTKKENGKDIIKNQEEYYDKSLINTGDWLYQNEKNFNEDQKSRLKEVGYYDGPFETHFYYLTKLKEQGKPTNLTQTDKIRVKEEGTVEVVKQLTKRENGKQITINKEEYNDKSLINTGNWLYTNQKNFNENQKSRLREVGYKLKEDKENMYNSAKQEFDSSSNFSRVNKKANNKEADNGRKIS